MAATNKCLAQSNKSCAGERVRRRFANEWRVTKGKDGGALLLLPLKISRLRTRTVPPSCSELPIPGRPGMNLSHHGSDEQMFGAKQQVCGGRG